MGENEDENKWTRVTLNSTIRNSKAPNGKHGNCFEPLEVSHSSKRIYIKEEL